jgi:hydroxyacylglutathione hydrolase/adenylyltransferase/sulfurtransferase
MPEDTATATELAPDEVARRVEAGEADLIDTRRDYEWDAGHIPGARRIEMNDLQAQADSLDKERTTIFYCRSGNRSGMAAAAFRDAGFDAYNMAGGIIAWTETGHPLEPADGEVVDPRPT